MKQGIFEIIENTALTESVFRMRLRGDTSAITAAGQFVNIQLAGKYLRRPISVCEVSGDVLTIVYKVVGSGTEQMSQMSCGEKLDILTGLVMVIIWSWQGRGLSCWVVALVCLPCTNWPSA